jgi:protein-disulfide isomerase
MTTDKLAVRADDHIEGDPNAECTLMEYGDYQCPHCGRAYPIVKRVQKHFGKRLRFVFRNFPLNEIHPQAEAAAETAEFAAEGGKYWEMHDYLFENQAHFAPPFFEEAAQKLGLDSAALREALATGKYRAHVRSDFMSGARSGVNGTPTFFINGQRLDGSWDYQELVEAIENQMAA